MFVSFYVRLDKYVRFGKIRRLPLASHIEIDFLIILQSFCLMIRLRAMLAGFLLFGRL